jgi:hypothetical protein
MHSRNDFQKSPSPPPHRRVGWCHWVSGSSDWANGWANSIKLPTHSNCARLNHDFVGWRVVAPCCRFRHAPQTKGGRQTKQTPPLHPLLHRARRPRWGGEGKGTASLCTAAAVYRRPRGEGSGGEGQLSAAHVAYLLLFTDAVGPDSRIPFPPLYSALHPHPPLRSG